MDQRNRSLTAELAHFAPHVALIGAMGVGKSTVGAALAQLLRRPLVDLDGAIEAAAGRSVAAIFAADGEAAFRAAEQRALVAALAGPPAVIACGGGVAIAAANREALAQAAYTVCLVGPPSLLAARIAGDARRPLAGDAAALGALLATRRAAMATAADCTVDASVGTPDEVATRVWAAIAASERWQLRAVVLGGGAVVATDGAVRDVAKDAAGAIVDVNVCRLWAGAGVRAAALPALAAMASSRVAVVSDDTVWALHAGEVATALEGLGCRVERHRLAGDEAHKTLHEWAALVTALTRGGADRDLLVVAVGGGVVCDMAGFAAATALRGVRHALLPTTLLAQVDAAIGGKTGVDTVDGKNLVGAFYQPRCIVCDSDWLATLPQRELAAGMAEVIKTALVADATLWQLLLRHDAAGALWLPATLAEIVSRCAAAKLDVVRRDEREQGPRRALNFGHTLGHALEREAGFGVWLHGEAVAIGMRLALDVGVALAVTPPPLRDAVVELLERCGLPSALPDEFASVDGQRRLLAALSHDKKSAGAEVRFVLVAAPGSYVERRLTPAAIAAALGWAT